MITRSAKTTAERLASHHKRQTEKEKKLENRLFTLNEQIQYWTNSHNITTKTIENIHLFYDGF